MAPRYQVVIKNQAGTKVAIVTDFLGLAFSKRANSFGNYSLQINGDDPVVDLFELDGQIEFYRSDLELEDQLDWYLEFSGFHRTDVTQVFENGRKLYTSYGYGYPHLLNRRGIWYPSTSAQASKSGPAETVMKEFVDENAGPSATSPPRLEGSGVTTGLTIQADGAGGSTWSGARAYSNLLSVLQEIGVDAQIFFDVVSTGPATFEFRVYLNQRGEDRTTQGLNPATGFNSSGNAPVIFSLERTNVKELSYSINRGDEVNAVLVLGQGVEDERQLAERVDAAAIAASTWNRIETTRNASRESTLAALNSIGDSVLQEREKKTNFNFNPLQIPSIVYGRDYNWGDKVTARFEGNSFDLFILSVSVQVDREQAESIAFEFGENIS